LLIADSGKAALEAMEYIERSFFKEFVNLLLDERS
jgi:hypothetical protein